MTGSPTVLALFAQIDPQRLEGVCGAGDQANEFCGAVLRLTSSDVLARVAGAVVPAIARMVLIVVVAYVANRVLRRVIKRFVRGLTEQGLERLGTFRKRAPLAETGPIDLERAMRRTETIGGVLRSITTFLIWAIASIMVLDVVGVPVGPLIASAGIAGIALGFGAQNLVRDFLSGVFMLLEDQYGVGDIIDAGEASGVVEGITLRTTRLRDVEGTVWHVPNGEIRRIGNKSQQWARSLLDIGVAYNTDVTQATAVLKGVADELWRDPEWSRFILEEPEVWGLEQFGADQMTIRMVLKVQPASQWQVNRELRARIKRAFDAAGIEIPFPQRTIWVRGGGAPTVNPPETSG